MDLQAQLRLKKETVESLGAATYVVVPGDLYRAKVWQEKNPIRLLVESGERSPGPLDKMERIVGGTALADPAGYAAAVYGVVRPGHRDIDPGWFVIDRSGKITYISRWAEEGRGGRVLDVLEELKKGAR